MEMVQAEVVLVEMELALEIAVDQVVVHQHQAAVEMMEQEHLLQETRVEQRETLQELVDQEIALRVELGQVQVEKQIQVELQRHRQQHNLYQPMM